jgi:hypothetical protein
VVDTTSVRVRAYPWGLADLIMNPEHPLVEAEIAKANHQTVMRPISKAMVQVQSSSMV